MAIIAMIQERHIEGLRSSNRGGREELDLRKIWMLSLSVGAGSDDRYSPSRTKNE